MYVFRLEIHILKLEMYISSLEIQIIRTYRTLSI